MKNFLLAALLFGVGVLVGLHATNCPFLQKCCPVQQKQSCSEGKCDCSNGEHNCCPKDATQPAKKCACNVDCKCVNCKCSADKHCGPNCKCQHKACACLANCTCGKDCKCASGKKCSDKCNCK